MSTSREAAAEQGRKFDEVAGDYDELMQASLASSGESHDYFHEYKLGCLKRAGVRRGDRILDYGCGVGALLRVLARELSPIVGYDPSQASIARAREDFAMTEEAQLDFVHDLGELAGPFDVAVLSGVLHHVPPGERSDTLRHVRRLLRPGGRIFVFEHNPYNPLTVRAVEACPFDDDAILLPPGELRAHFSSAGFEGVQQDFIVFFPRLLARFRPLEPWLRRVPVGAQTLTMGRAP